MKKSIGIKLFIGITCFALIIVSMSWILNTQYLEDYYLDKKKDSLIKYGEEIQSIYNNNIDDIEDNLKQIEDIIGGDIIIFTVQGDIIYSSLFMQGNGWKGKGAIQGNIPLTRNDLERVLKGDTVLESYTHQRFKTTSLVLGLQLEDQQVLILVTPVAPIKESVEIAKDFHIYIGIISLIIGTILAFLFSRRFTKPIVELNDVARSMSKLDFSKKYKVKSDDEIGELGKTINYLSDKLDVSISELNEANKKLREDIEKERELDAMRKEFVSSVSHELKTPIALIQGYAEGLKDNVVVDEENKKFYCEVIIDESEKMDSLVKELLDLSQIETGHYKLQKENFNINNLVKKVKNKYKPILEEKNIDLQINEDDKTIEIHGDIVRIEQILVNFINNAINHVDDNKKITINIWNYNDKARVEVINTGKPIPEAEIDKIWDSFYKVDKSRARKYGGTGLGLSIVKGILELHNSSYGVSNTDDGVKFWFELDKYNGTNGASDSNDTQDTRYN